VTRTSGKAHGLVWYWNVLETDDYTSLPMHLMVEEGKHGIATDKNGDGVFTPGYDVNRRINDAWGCRDIMRTGMLFSGGYEQWMAKVRRPEHRVFPPLPDDSHLLAGMDRRMAEDGNAIYELRPLPTVEEAVQGDPGLRHFVENHGVVGWPTEATLHNVGDWAESLEEGAVLKSLSISFRYDGDAGFSFVFPLFIVKHFEEPMTGGYVLNRMYFKDDGLRDFGWMLMYTPSASRWIDTYLAAGGEQDEEVDAFGVTHRDWDFVFETGLKFRVDVTHTPMKFLAFLTHFWGVRAGIKNTGFEDVNRLTYVMEVGAGSF
jgi:hypothetical protein